MHAQNLSDYYKTIKACTKKKEKIQKPKHNLKITVYLLPAIHKEEENCTYCFEWYCPSPRPPQSVCRIAVEKRKTHTVNTRKVEESP